MSPFSQHLRKYQVFDQEESLLIDEMISIGNSESTVSATGHYSPNVVPPPSSGGILGEGGEFIGGEGGEHITGE